METQGKVSGTPHLSCGRSGAAAYRATSPAAGPGGRGPPLAAPRTGPSVRAVVRGWASRGTELCQVAQHLPSKPACLTPLLQCTASRLHWSFFVFVGSAAVSGKRTRQGVGVLTLGPNSVTHSLRWASVVFSVNWAGAGIKQDLR